MRRWFFVDIWHDGYLLELLSEQVTIFPIKPV